MKSFTWLTTGQLLRWFRRALQEDAGIAISSYQGGHVEYFKYIVDMLNANGAGHIKVFSAAAAVLSCRKKFRSLGDHGVTRFIHPRME
ncbi:MAG: cobalamin B12-binding domain-containing protein [Candidatus Azotimanducaceae bacterium WSBS_2022_MAG_OTU7]